jgi:ketosteroid isomerase-like protein
MKQLLLIIGLATIIFACQPMQNELTPEQRQDIANDIKQNFNDWTEKMGNPDYTWDDSTSMWVESDDEAWMNNPALWLNMMTLYPTKENIDEVWGPIGEVRSSTNYYIDEDYVAVISAECAVYVFKGSFTITNKEGNTIDPVPMSGSYVYVLRNDEWKMLHMHQSWKTD